MKTPFGPKGGSEKEHEVAVVRLLLLFFFKVYLEEEVDVG